MGIAEFNRNTTAQRAAVAGREYARQLKALSPCYFGPDDAACTQEKHGAMKKALWEMWVVAEQLAPEPRNAFLYELGREMGGIRLFTVVPDTDHWGDRRYYQTDEKQLGNTPPKRNYLLWDPEPNVSRRVWRRSTGDSWPAPKTKPVYGISHPDLEEYDHYEPVRLKASILVIPVTAHMVREGEVYAFTFAVIDETSNAKGQEGSVEVYVSAEAGMKASLNLPVVSFSFDVKTGIKRAEKVYTRREERTVVRATMQVSKSYLLQTIARSVRIYGPRGAYYNVEVGYRIERKEGGAPLGPFWPDYTVDGHQTKGDSAFAKARAQLMSVLEEAAQGLARRMAQG